jgi:hypothetical protein
MTDCSTSLDISTAKGFVLPVKGTDKAFRSDEVILLVRNKRQSLKNSARILKVTPGSFHTRQRLRQLDARFSHLVMEICPLIAGCRGGQPGKGYRSGLLYRQKYTTKQAL